MQGPLWDLIPEPILQRCIKVADEAPADLKSNLRRAYSKFSQDSIEECKKPKEAPQICKIYKIYRNYKSYKTRIMQFVQILIF